MSDCEPATMTKILWTSAKRCSFVLNARGWKCKRPPTKLLRFDSDHRGGYYCDEHVAELTAPCASVPA